MDTGFIACADSTYYESERGFLAVEGGSEEGMGRGRQAGETTVNTCILWCTTG